MNYNDDDFLELFSGEGKTIVPDRLFRIMNPIEACVFGLLMRHWKKRDDQGWFSVTSEMIENVLNVSDAQQRLAVDELANRKGFIQRKMIGMPAKRHFRINVEAVVRAYDLSKQKRLKSPVPLKMTRQAPMSPINTHYIRINKKKTKTVDHFESEPDLLGQLPKKDPKVNSDHIRMANELHLALRHHQRITKSASMKSWAKQIAMIEYLDKVPAAHIQEVLDYYRNNIGKGFMPQAYSGKAFREKFNRIREHFDENRDHEIADVLKDTVQTIRSTLPWPKEVKGEVDNCCQILFQNYVQFFNRVHDMIPRLSKNASPLHPHPERKALRLILKKLQDDTPNGSTFVRDFMKDLSKQLHGWKDWSGNLRSMLWKGGPGHKRFDKLLRRYCRTWTDADFKLYHAAMGVMFNEG